MHRTRHTLDVLEMLVGLGPWDGGCSFELEVGAHGLPALTVSFPVVRFQGERSCLFV